MSHDAQSTRGRFPLIVALLALLASALLTAPAASASTSGHSSTRCKVACDATGPLRHASPQTSQVITYDNLGAVNSLYPCTIHNWTYPSWPIADVSNGCGGAVVLHEFSDGGDEDPGWPSCIPAGQFYWIASSHWYPGRLDVTSGGC